MLYNEARRKSYVMAILLVKNFAGTGIRTHNILTQSFLHHSHILLTGLGTVGPQLVASTLGNLAVAARAIV